MVAVTEVVELSTMNGNHTRLSTPNLELARTMLRIVPRINRWAESRALESERGADLSLRQLSALAVIESETTTLGDVARRLMVTPAVVTGLIDRLERRGFVRRIGGGSDRRRVHLTLTDEGRQASEYVEDHLVQELAHRLESLSGDEIEQMHQSLNTLGRITSDLESRVNH